MVQNKQTAAKATRSSGLQPEPGLQQSGDLKKEKLNMPNGQRKDPFHNYNFLIEIDGITQGGFMECTGLESRTRVIRYREGIDSNTPRLLPGLNIYSNICLKRGMTDSKELSNWRKTVVDGQILRKNGSIILTDQKHQEVARWNFREGWPCRLTGPELNALGNEIAIEEIEICHEGIEQV